MFSWIEQRLKLKEFFIRPIFPRGMGVWFYFPGVFAIILLVWQALTGIALACFYPSEISGIFGSFRTAHWLGANTLIVAVFLHFLRNLFHTTYSKPRELVWLSGMVLFLVLCIACLSGSMLPRDAQGITTTRFCIQCLENLSVVGKTIVSLCDLHRLFSPEPKFPIRLYIFHISLFPLSILLLTILHLWSLQRTGITNVTKKQASLPFDL